MEPKERVAQFHCAPKSKVEAEFIDNSKGFKWRLVKGEEKSPWSKHYEGILVHTFKNGEKWGLATQYWSCKEENSLPIEIPFQIIVDRKSTRLNSSHIQKSRMPSSA